ncbi:MAG: hypothetical protein IJZ05_06815 [Rikenellaceae bacterium]|nr:hypothetical protein [Rikenellaceae bacterium]
MGHHHDPNQPFSIPQIRFIPEKVKPWLLILFIIVFNCTGGVYLAAVSDMVGSTQLLQEDIMMAGYASLVGMALFFAIMFRMKWAVRPKTALGSCILVLIVANLICMHTSSVPLLVGVCLVSGFFRMWAIYECNSTIQLWITPKRDMSIWFCYIYLMVNGTIQLTGIAALSLSVWASWHYMYWLIIGALLVMYLIVIICYKGIRIMPRLPLLGIDWVGMLLWATTAMSILFVCVYGEHYDWWQSEHIWFATVLAVVTFGMNWWRSTYLRHPYIGFNIFKFPLVLTCVAVILVMDLLLAPSHIFEHALMESVLGYDHLNTLTLNWVSIIGVVIGIVFTWQTFARRKWSYQRMLVIAFSCFAVYLAYFYFRIDYNIPKEALYLPVILRSAGYVMVAVMMLTANARLPFPYTFLHGLSFQNMFSAALAAPIGNAIVGRVLKMVMARNSMLLSERMDNVGLSTSHAPFGELYGMVQVQSLLESMKEIYGWLLFVAIVCLIGLMLRYSGIRPMKVIEPTYSAIYNFLRHEIKPRLQIRRHNQLKEESAGLA